MGRGSAESVDFGRTLQQIRGSEIYKQYLLHTSICQPIQRTHGLDTNVFILQ